MHDDALQRDRMPGGGTLDPIRSLAERLSEPIVIIDPGYRIIYVNRTVRRRYDLRPGGPRHCYHALSGVQEPCRGCPAPVVLATGRPAEPEHGLDLPCGLALAVPVAGGTEGAASVVMVLDGEVSERRVVQAAPVVLVGQSPPMRRLQDMIDLVADSQAAVLIQGESGTGKELVARTIHQRSSRRDGPFVVVDCGSLPETLLESELFGHVKGAFTGALFKKRGLFEEAKGGTIFLDEIGDISPHFQAKLLRVLQEREVKPVGGLRPVRIDARIVSASNKPLLRLIEAKAFREDLYYRLAVLPMDVPPLRERREDIPLLVEHFLRQVAQRHGKSPARVTAEAMAALVSAPWPGNVRELQHTIERAVITAGRAELALQDFPSLAPREPGSPDLRTLARDAAASVEKARIEEALRQCGGSRAEAARALRISRASLYNKLRAYGLTGGRPPAPRGEDDATR